MTSFVVQFVVIKAVRVEADDELQAEREAFQKLSWEEPRLVGGVIAMRVLNREHDTGDPDLGEAGLGGALAFDDNRKNWRLAKDCFEPVNQDWVS